MQKLFLFLLILLAIWYVRRALAGTRENRERRTEQPHAGPQEMRSEMMRECCRCGVLVPESEGVQSDGKFYCCAEHAAARSERSDS